MVESFKKLKGKAAKKAILLALITGLSGAGLVFGALFLLVKRTEINFPWYGYLLSCVGVFLLVGGALLLLTYPFTKRFARSLDRRYSLGEKVQTMVEFSQKDTPVLSLQREQTEQILSTLPKQRKSFFSYLRIILTPVLAVAMLSVAIALPKKTAPAPIIPGITEEPPYIPDKWDTADLEMLIANVKGSTLTDELKPVYVATLETFKENLEKGEWTTGEMQTAVRATMELLIGQTKSVNTFNVYVDGLAEKENFAELEPLITAFKESSRAYTEIEGTSVLSYATLEDRTADIHAVVTAKWRVYTATVNELIAKTTDEESYKKFAEGYADLLGKALLLPEVAKLPENEGINKELAALKQEITQSVTLFDEGLQIAGVKSTMKVKLENFVVVSNEPQSGISWLMDEQANSVMLRDYVVYTLGDMFDVRVPDEELGEYEKEEDKTPPDTEYEGKEWPSAGEILDPELGESADPFRPYFQLVNRYQGYITDCIEEDREKAKETGKEPTISEDLEKLIESFFDALEK